MLSDFQNSFKKFFGRLRPLIADMGTIFGEFVVDCEWIKRRATALTVNDLGETASDLLRQIREVERQERSPYDPETGPGPRLLFLLPSWKLNLSCLLLATSVLALVLCLYPERFLSPGAIAEGVLLGAGMSLFAIAIPLVATYGSLRSQNEYATRCLWVTTNLGWFTITACCSVLLGIGLWLVGPPDQLLPKLPLDVEFFCAAIAKFPLAAAAVGLTAATVIGLLALLLEVICYAKDPEFAELAWQQHESRSLVRRLLVWSFQTLPEGQGASPTQDDQTWEAELLQRAQHWFQTGNLAAFGRALDTLHSSVVEFARRYRNACASWTPHLSSHLRRYFVLKHSELLEGILRRLGTTEMVPTTRSLRFISRLQSSFRTAVVRCFEQGLVDLLDLYLQELPFLYSAQIGRAQEEEGKDKKLAESLYYSRGFWGVFLTNPESLVEMLPAQLTTSKRTRCLMILHTHGTVLLRQAVRHQDKDMIREVAEALGAVYELSKSQPINPE